LESAGDGLIVEVESGAPKAKDVSGLTADAAPAVVPPVSETREKVLILGRRQSGKTVFLTRLYEALWQEAEIVGGRYLPGQPAQPGVPIRKLRAKATQGPLHRELRQMAVDLEQGRWPAATFGTKEIEIHLTFDGRKFVMGAMDYPGEVFTKAFVQDSQDPDAKALRHAVDRAAAIMLLVDPDVLAKRGMDLEDDLFGLVGAIQRVRNDPSGAKVPIAVVLTKSDRHVALIKHAGGARAFCKQHLPQLFNELGKTMVFASSAITTVKGIGGKRVPRSTSPPIDVVEPLVYCLDRMVKEQDRAADRTERERREVAMLEVARQEAEAERRSSSYWLMFWIAVPLLIVVVGGLTWWFKDSFK
jgi:hypothetical protein